MATAIRRLESGGAIPQDDAETALREALRLRVALRTPGGLPLQSLHLARELGVARTRDTAYLALALREACPLFTMDERFIRNAAPRGYAVRHPVTAEL